VYFIRITFLLREATSIGTASVMNEQDDDHYDEDKCFDLDAVGRRSRGQASILDSRVSR